jgi:predicted anti-sigma-YlaC factor YlaD
LNYLVLRPYLDWRSQLVERCNAKAGELDEAHRTLKKAADLRKLLIDMAASFAFAPSERQARQAPATRRTGYRMVTERFRSSTVHVAKPMFMPLKWDSLGVGPDGFLFRRPRCIRICRHSCARA